MQCSPTVNVDRLKPFFERDGVDPTPRSVSDVGQEGEHVVELLRNRTEKRGATRYVVRWRGHTSADDKRLRAEELAHCPEKKVAEYYAPAPRCWAASRGESTTAAIPMPAVRAGARAAVNLRPVTLVTGCSSCRVSATIRVGLL